MALVRADGGSPDPLAALGQQPLPLGLPQPPRDDYVGAPDAAARATALGLPAGAQPFPPLKPDDVLGYKNRARDVLAGLPALRPKEPTSAGARSGVNSSSSFLKTSSHRATSRPSY